MLFRYSSIALMLGALSLLISSSGCSKPVAGAPPANAASKSTAAERDSEDSATRTRTRTRSQQTASVQTVKPTRRDLVQKFQQPGIVEAAASADLFSRISGYVDQVKVDIGDTVEAGDVILVVDVPELAQELALKEALVGQAEAELAQAQTTVESAEGAIEIHGSQMELVAAEIKKAGAERNFRQREFERFAALAADKSGSQQVADEKALNYEAARAAYDSAMAKQAAVRSDLTILKAKLSSANADVRAKTAKVAVASADREKTRVLSEYAKLKAPYAGTITRRTVDPGEYVHSPNNDKATPLFTISRTESMTIIMRVPEKEVPFIKIGNPVQMQFDSLQGQVVPGAVTRMAKSLDEKSRTMRIEIDVKNPNGKLYPGMFGSVSLLLADVKDALVVPASALYGTGEGLFVVTVKNGTTQRKKVETGYDDGRNVQVVSGLSENEEVVVSNKGNLADGQSVVPSRGE